MQLHQAPVFTAIVYLIQLWKQVRRRTGYNTRRPRSKFAIAPAFHLGMESGTARAQVRLMARNRGASVRGPGQRCVRICDNASSRRSGFGAGWNDGPRQPRERRRCSGFGDRCRHWDGDDGGWCPIGSRRRPQRHRILKHRHPGGRFPEVGRIEAMILVAFSD